MKDRNEIKTTFLLHELRESKSIYQYFQENHEFFSEAVFSEYLQQLIMRNKVPKAEMVARSGLSKSYAYAILSGERQPSNRNRVLALAFAVKANLEETQNLLVYSEFNQLTPKVQRDAAIIFGIEQELDFQQVNELLFDLQLDDLY